MKSSKSIKNTIIEERWLPLVISLVWSLCDALNNTAAHLIGMANNQLK